MLVALALCSSLAALPSGPEASPRESSILDAPRSARLVVDADDVADAPVDRLTHNQLKHERQRLVEEFPTLTGPIVLLAVGGSGIFAFGGLTYYFAVLTSRSTSLSAVGLGILAVFTGALAAVAIAAAIVGMVFLLRQNNRRDVYARRGDEVDARLEAIASGRVVPLPEPAELAELAELAIDRDVRLLRERRPGLGLPFGLLGGGAGATAYVMIGFLGGSVATAAYPIYIGAGVAAAALVVTGTILLVQRLHARSAIDRQIDELDRNGSYDDGLGSPPPMPPPAIEDSIPGGQLPPPPPPPSAWAPPPAPIALSWAVSF